MLQMQVNDNTEPFISQMNYVNTVVVGHFICDSLHAFNCSIDRTRTSWGHALAEVKQCIVPINNPKVRTKKIMSQFYLHC